MKTPNSQVVPRLLAVVLLCVIAAGCAPKPPEHGTTLVLAPVADAQGNRPAAEAWRAGTEVALTRRFKAAGLQPFFKAVPTNQLQVTVAAISGEELAAVKAMLTRPGRLAFRFAHPQSDELVSKGESAPGHELLIRKERRPTGADVTEQVLVEQAEDPALGSGAVKQAFVSRNQIGEPEIDFELTSGAATAFAKLTRDNIGRRLAIVVDGQLFSAPVIRSEIPGGRGQITGQFTVAEAMALANVLASALPVRLEIVEEKSF